MEAVMTALSAEIGKEYTVMEVEMEGATKRRLAAIGLIKGTKVKVFTRKVGGAIVLKVRGSRYAFGKEIAQHIMLAEG